MTSPPPGLTRVAVYRRTVAASEERVWENARDWEHLPWLHRASFRSIALEEQAPWGWRARVGLHPAQPGHEILLELRIEGGAPCYVARTLAGPGAGSEIWTQIAPRSLYETDVEVAFWLPGVARKQVDAFGATYTRLYRRLWDEDEGMMVRRAEQLAAVRLGPGRPPASLDLGPREALRAKLPVCVDLEGRRWRVVEVDGALHVHAALCPHWLGPLEDAPVEAGIVTCPWHGWHFDVRNGRRVGAPPHQTAGRARLARPPRIEIDCGGVRLVASDAGSRRRRS